MTREVPFGAVGCRIENRKWNKMLIWVKTNLDQPRSFLSHHIKGRKVVFDRNSPLIIIIVFIVNLEEVCHQNQRKVALIDLA